MTVKSCEKLEKSRVALTIETSAEEFEAAVNKAYLKMRGKINVPGFRVGKAPRKIIEKMYGAEVFYEEAVNIILPDAYEAAVKEQELEVVGYPQVELESCTKDGVVFKCTVAVYPEVKLGQYKGLEAPKAEVKVVAADVNARLKEMADRNSRLVSVERAVKKGDTADIDFEGFDNGVAFDGGKGENFDLEIGSGSFVPGFEDQLIGAKIGEEREVNVKFPEEYHAKELAGKDAKFECTIRSIKTKELPAIDDELAKKVSTFQTLDELKADIRKNLTENAERTAENDQKSAAIEMATNNITVDIPAVMIDNRVTAMIQEMAMRLEQQGMKFEQYLQYAGTDIAKLREQYRETAEKNVKTDLMLEEVAKAENIKVEANDLDAEVAAMAAAYGATPKQVQKIIKEQGRIGDLAASVLRKKTAQFIIDNIAE